MFRRKLLLYIDALLHSRQIKIRTRLAQIFVLFELHPSDLTSFGVAATPLTRLVVELPQLIAALRRLHQVDLLVRILAAGLRYSLHGGFLVGVEEIIILLNNLYVILPWLMVDVWARQIVITHQGLLVASVIGALMLRLHIILIRMEVHWHLLEATVSRRIVHTILLVQ